jgi:hypothetical protein
MRLNCLGDNSVIFFRVLVDRKVCDLDVGLRWNFGVEALRILYYVCSTIKILHDLSSNRRSAVCPDQIPVGTERTKLASGAVWTLR